MTDMRRGLPEPVRFAEPQEQRPHTRAMTAPLAALIAVVWVHPTRLMAMSVVAFLIGFAESPAFFFN